VQKLTNRDIERIVKQWHKKKSLPEIANYFGVSRQWIHHIIKRFTPSGIIPVLHFPGRKSKYLHEET
jgi:transposase